MVGLSKSNSATPCLQYLDTGQTDKRMEGQTDRWLPNLLAEAQKLYYKKLNVYRYKLQCISLLLQSPKRLYNPDNDTPGRRPCSLCPCKCSTI